MFEDRIENPLGTVDMLARNWWLFALRGLASLAFAVLGLFWLRITLNSLIHLFGAYALVNGGLALAAATYFRKGHAPAVRLASSGAISIIAGLLALFMPGFDLLNFLTLVSFWAIVTGFVELASSMRWRREVGNEWFLLPASVISIALGAILMVAPMHGAHTIASWIGGWALVYGALMLALGFRLHMREPKVETRVPAHA